jgi:menaquinol-cytochrome c reductase iron-sulfur subunit
MTRRDFYRFATIILNGLMGLALALPALAYLFTPFRKKGREGGFEPLTRLSQLKVGVPQSFAIIERRQDAWVKYPAEPVASVWLIRQPEGGAPAERRVRPAVIAFTSECPHLGCAINLTADGKDFLCPCHTSSFDMDGNPRNSVPPRAMDRLDVEISDGVDPEVRVKFQRFRTLSKEKVPLV